MESAHLLSVNYPARVSDNYFGKAKRITLPEPIVISRPKTRDFEKFAQNSKTKHNDSTKKQIQGENLVVLDNNANASLGTDATRNAGNQQSSEDNYNGKIIQGKEIKMNETYDLEKVEAEGDVGAQLEAASEDSEGSVGLRLRESSDHLHDKPEVDEAEAVDSALNTGEIQVSLCWVGSMTALVYQTL